MSARNSLDQQELPRQSQNIIEEVGIPTSIIEHVKQGAPSNNVTREEHIPVPKEIKRIVHYPKYQVEERVIQVPKPIVKEQVVNIPEIEWVEKIVEVPQYVYRERCIEVVRPVFHERIIPIPPPSVTHYHADKEPPLCDDPEPRIQSRTPCFRPTLNPKYSAPLPPGLCPVIYPPPYMPYYSLPLYPYPPPAPNPSYYS